IAKITGHCERTIRYWKYYLKNPTSKPPNQKRGRRRIMDEDTLALLYLDFLHNNDKFQRERAELILKEKKIEVSQQVISYNLKKDIGFTRKKGTKRYSGLNMEEARLLDMLGREEIALPRLSSQGKIFKKEKGKKNKIKKGTDAIDFYNFLKDIELPDNEMYHALLDNSKIHSAPDKLKKAGLLSMEELALQKNIILVYLPRYAPQLNPAELCINFIRNRIESNKPQTEEELKKVVEEAVDLLNKLDLTKSFQHCRDYFFVLLKNGK
ncbi:6561_t:CDS:2, partial [Scutellospora calospora]